MRSDGEASLGEPRSVRGTRSLKHAVERAFRAGQPFDDRIDAQFPAFRGRDVVRVARAQGFGQRLERVLPEWSHEFVVTHGEPPLQ